MPFPAPAIVALWNNEVVGTLSVIRDSKFGFPSNKIFDVSGLRQNGTRIAELSAFALREDFRSQGGKLMFPLFRYVYEYCLNYFGVDYWVIAVNPKHVELYQAILFFRRLKSCVVDNYDYVNGAPAVGQYIALKSVYPSLAIHYGKNSRHTNLFEYAITPRPGTCTFRIDDIFEFPTPQ